MTLPKLNNRRKFASSDTEKEIWAAAQKLHYQKNRAAASLKTGHSPDSAASKSWRIGIVMARGLESLEDEFYARIEESVRSTVLREGHQLAETLMLRTALEEPRRLQGVDGLVLLGKCKVHSLTSLRSICKHLSCTGMNPYQLDIDQVYCNGEHIARTAVRTQAEEPSVSEAERILSEIDMNTLSPMQAFSLLSDLVEKVKNKQGQQG